MTLKNKINAALTKLSNSLSQTGTDRSGAAPVITAGMPELLRRVAGEGAVLLENNGVLPFPAGTKLSLFGTTASRWFYVGYGSGGDVNSPYKVNLTDAVRNCDRLKLNENLARLYSAWLQKNPISDGVWGHWIFHNPEMPVDEKTVSQAAEESDAAVVTIGRSSGEDRDCKYEKGSYLLTDDENKILDLVCRYFKKVAVLLNAGGIMDMRWVKKYGGKIGAVLCVWQGGMESGNAVCDLLCGKTAPSGRLADTIAEKYSDSPSSANFGAKKFVNYEEDIYVGYRYFETFNKKAVLYPFGYGLGYTDFRTEHIAAGADGGGFCLKVRVTNTGAVSGRETVQIYLEKPCGALGNPEVQLAGFQKTKELPPGESEEIELYIKMVQLASYDDCGATSHMGAYVLEAGEYKLYIGKNAREKKQVFTYFQNETAVFEKLKQAAAPQADLEILCARQDGEKRVAYKKQAVRRKYDLAAEITNRIPKAIEQTGDLGYKLKDVKDGRVTLEQFTAQLTLTELEAVTRGDYTMNSPLGAKGNAGVFGGVLQSLRDKGVPAVTVADGPAGIRLAASCSLLPIGTLLGCTFNPALVEELYTLVAHEMKDRGADVLLAPGMNIHRNVFCGRNFEYFSEDPYLTGKMGAAAVRGIQKFGASACPKHFACNNQEYRRSVCDSRLSERALREIYLKGFEICVKEAKPKNIMTSYNKINGVWGHYNYDLCTAILRDEWGYSGNVMTDWWMKKSKSPEFPALRDNAYRIRAQVDLLMPGGGRITNRKPDGTLLQSCGKPGGITLGEIQRSAMNVLGAVMDIEWTED